MPELTNKQQRFCEEYLIDMNQTDAARRAGYSDGSYGRQLLTKPHVQAHLKKLIEARSERTQIHADSVLREIARLAFSNIEDYLTFGPDGVTLKHSEHLTREQLAAVQSVSESNTQYGRNISFKLANKLSALELLGRHLALFTDNMQHSLDETKGALTQLFDAMKQQYEREQQ